MDRPKKLLAKVTKLWAPPPVLTLTEWAEANFFLSSEASAETGEFRAKPFQVEPLNAFTDPRVETVVIMSATQMLKTTHILVALGYIMDRDPGPTMLIAPRDSDVDRFSKIRLAPMLRDTPCLRGKVSESKSRDNQNTLNYKKFDGGHLAMTGSGSPGNLAALPIRYLLCDEIDKYPASSGSEGDPISLARKRTITFRRRRKIVLTCSPTVAGRSRIAKAYENSDRREYFVPCPYCRKPQVLKWNQVKWDTSLAVPKQPSTAYYECEHCARAWSDQQRRQAVERGHWRALGTFTGAAGFRISELYSPWRTLSEIVSDWLEKKDDPEQRKTFVNTTLAELWEEEGETPDWKALHDRHEPYPFGAEPAVSNDEAVIPRRALFLTAGVDWQDERIEYEVTGWGRGKETWSSAYGVIRLVDERNHPIKTHDFRYLDELEKVLARDWKHEGGRTMPIMAMAIDTGNRPKPVYEFAKRHAQLAVGPAGYRVHAPRTVIPVKGTSRESLRVIASITKEDAARKRQNVRIVSVGTGVAKQELYDNLRMHRPGVGMARAGYCHYPAYNEEYFQGLCNEKRIVHENGTVTWEKIGRNEPLDCRVYAMAAAYAFGIDRMNEMHWQQLEHALGVDEPPPPPSTPSGATTPVASPQQRPQRRVSRSNWLSR